MTMRNDGMSDGPNGKRYRIKAVNPIIGCDIRGMVHIGPTEYEIFDTQTGKSLSMSYGDRGQARRRCDELNEGESA